MLHFILRAAAGAKSDGGGAVAELISKLFGNGEQGAFYLPDPEYLYQDAAGTIAVAADGDPVGYVRDLSGNGNHATQPTDTARPIYRVEGNFQWIEADGSTQYLVVTARESMRWATHNAATTPRYTSHYSIQAKVMGSANSLSGFGLTGTPEINGDFFRDNGQFSRRVGKGVDIDFSTGTPTTNALLDLALDAQPGSGAEWFINGHASGFIAETAEMSDTLTMRDWGLMAQGDGSFKLYGKLFGAVFHEGAKRQDVSDYMHALLYGEGGSAVSIMALKVFYDMEDISGTTLIDQNGKADGEIVGSPTVVTGVTGNALSFDGANDYVEIGTTPLLDAFDELTISVWIKGTSSGTFFSQIGPAISGFVILRAGEGNEDFRLRSANGSDLGGVYFNTNVMDGAWHHIVAQYDAQGPRLYVDNALDMTPDPDTYESNFGVGQVLANAGRDSRGQSYFNGSIDQLRVYTRSLGEVERTALYNEGA